MRRRAMSMSLSMSPWRMARWRAVRPSCHQSITASRQQQTHHSSATHQHHTTTDRQLVNWTIDQFHVAPSAVSDDEWLTGSNYSLVYQIILRSATSRRRNSCICPVHDRDLSFVWWMSSNCNCAPAVSPTRYVKLFSNSITRQNNRL